MSNAYNLPFVRWQTMTFDEMKEALIGKVLYWRSRYNFGRKWRSDGVVRDAKVDEQGVTLVCEKDDSVYVGDWEEAERLAREGYTESCDNYEDKFDSSYFEFMVKEGGER